MDRHVCTYGKRSQEEGFPELAAKFEGVAKVEAAHEKRYLKLLEHYKQEIPSKVMHLLDGNAEIVDTFTKATRLLKYVRYVLTHELILREQLKIIKNQSTFPRRLPNRRGTFFFP